MRISIIGVDYRSTIVAGCLSYRGHRVIGVDPRPARADWLNRSGAESLAPGLEVLLEQGRQAGLLSGTTDLPSAVRDTDITFLDGAGEGRRAGDMESRCRQIGEALRGKDGSHRLLVRSNKPRERVLAVLLPILESSSGKKPGQGFQIEVSADYLDERDGMSV